MNPGVRAAPMPQPVLVAVAHGSADPRASDTIRKLMAMVAERAAGLDVRTAYLGHALPSLPQVMTAIDPGRPVTVVPLLLTAAYHSKADIPRILARFPRPHVRYGAPLGPHPLLLPALERRLAQADPGAFEDAARTAVVLAAAGSAIPTPTPPSRASRCSGTLAPDGSPPGRLTRPQRLLIPQRP